MVKTINKQFIPTSNPIQLITVRFILVTSRCYNLAMPYLNVP